MSLVFVLAAVFIPLLLFSLKHVPISRVTSQFPPGPSPLPILGNLFDWPVHSGWLTFTEWTKKYGDLVHIQILGVHIIVIGSIEIAQDLMNQAIYSDRPRLPMAGELMGFSPSIVLSPYGEHWRAMRKITTRFLGKSMATLWPSIISDSRLLVRTIFESPDEYRSAIRFALGKNIIENTYGIKVEDPTNQFISMSRQTHETIQHAVVPGSFLVDVFPILKHVPSWLPGAGFKQLAHVAKSRGQKMVNTPFEISKAVHMPNESNHAMVPSLLRDFNSTDPPGKQHSAEIELQIKWAAASLYGAGTESTASALSTFVFMMATHPEIQQKAQREIDAVTQGTRLPTNEDLKDLPYIDAIMKETLRFHAPTPLGIAHRLTQDDIYKGYHLPKGAIILANIWGMNRDSRYYTNATQFSPERFLEFGDEIELDPATSVFGFGRRACLGVQYATAVLFINMASILSVYSISTENTDIQPSFSGGFVSHVRPIQYSITPRSVLAEQLIRGIELK
ncbi:cytochrome P450 [Mycena epipterygia]|nr:cytochrome P450 [Mycena epipterygia]